MNREEAIEWLEKLRAEVQHNRSILMEVHGFTDDDHVGISLQPWLLGDRCILKPIAILLDSGIVTLQDIANISSVVKMISMLQVSMVAHSVPILNPMTVYEEWKYD